MSDATDFCPYCGHFYALAGRVQYDQNVFPIQNKYGDHIIVASRISVCGNPDCLHPIVHVGVGTSRATNQYYAGDYLYESIAAHKAKQIVPFFRILPANGGKFFPAVPDYVWNDYDEACKITELSPKAAATIARRCLQNMIRDFWNISKRTLDLEIKEVAQKPEVSQAVKDVLHDIRELGNIGAHPEENVNIIVDIEPGEVALIIGVIEMLFVAWYGKRAEEQKLLSEVKQLNATKQQARNS